MCLQALGRPWVARNVQFCFLEGGRSRLLVFSMSDRKPASLVMALFLQAENIVLLELDMPSRTTRDYEGPAIAPKVQAALDAALQDEDEIQVDASSFESTTNKKSKARWVTFDDLWLNRTCLNKDKRRLRFIVEGFTEHARKYCHIAPVFIICSTNIYGSGIMPGVMNTRMPDVPSSCHKDRGF